MSAITSFLFLEKSGNGVFQNPDKPKMKYTPCESKNKNVRLSKYLSKESHGLLSLYIGKNTFDIQSYSLTFKKHVEKDFYFKKKFSLKLFPAYYTKGVNFPDGIRLDQNTFYRLIEYFEQNPEEKFENFITPERLVVLFRMIEMSEDQKGKSDFEHSFDTYLAVSGKKPLLWRDLTSTALKELKDFMVQYTQDALDGFELDYEKFLKENRENF